MKNEIKLTLSPNGYLEIVDTPFETTRKVVDYEDEFYEKHVQLYNQQRQSCLGFFRSTAIDHESKNFSLLEILEHAKNRNNRSRKICILLRWMDSKGRLDKRNAPVEIQKAYNQIQPRSN